MKNKKNLICVHIKKDETVLLYFEKIDKESSKKITWNTIADFKIKINVTAYKDNYKQDNTTRDNYKFNSICLHSSICKIINKIESISIYLNNFTINCPKNNFILKADTVQIILKDGTLLEFDQQIINGKTIYNNQVCIVLPFN